MLGQSGTGRKSYLPIASRVADAVRFGSLLGSSEMPCVRFEWNPVLIELRREVCPNARWQKQGRHWLMTDADAERFIRTAQARLDFQRQHAPIRIDDIIWVVGFVEGAPYRLTPPGVQRVGPTDHRVPARQP